MALQYEEFEVGTSRLIHEFFPNRTWIEVGLYRGRRVALKSGRFLQKELELHQKLGSHPNIIEFIAEVQDGRSEGCPDSCRLLSLGIGVNLDRARDPTPSTDCLRSRIPS